MRTEIKAGIAAAVIVLIGGVLFMTTRSDSGTSKDSLPLDSKSGSGKAEPKSASGKDSKAPARPGQQNAPSNAGRSPAPGAARPGTGDRAGGAPTGASGPVRPAPAGPGAAGSQSPGAAGGPPRGSGLPPQSPGAKPVGSDEARPGPASPPGGTDAARGADHTAATRPASEGPRTDAERSGAPSRSESGAGETKTPPLPQPGGDGADVEERPAAPPGENEKGAVATPPAPSGVTPTKTGPGASPPSKSEPLTPGKERAVPGAPVRGSAAPGGGTSYTIQDGDTLSYIARERYGDDRYWTKIKEANPNIDPDHLLVGQTIVLPPKDAVVGAKPAADKAKETPSAAKEEAAKKASAKGAAEGGGAAKSTRTYIVAKGDTLASIARAVLKDVNRWREIYELNKEKIKDPDVLHEGTELKLPPAKEEPKPPKP
jgi:nucleoid-associated protein YgaU